MNGTGRGQEDESHLLPSARPGRVNCGAPVTYYATPGGEGESSDGKNEEHFTAGDSWRTDYDYGGLHRGVRQDRAGNGKATVAARGGKRAGD